MAKKERRSKTNTQKIITMETTNEPKGSAVKVIGYILIAPAVMSVALFFIDLITEDSIEILRNLSIYWSGDYGYYSPHYSEGGGGGGGFGSTLPLYFGLMAIAGAYLIKDK